MRVQGNKSDDDGYGAPSEWGKKSEPSDDTVKN